MKVTFEFDEDKFMIVGDILLFDIETDKPSFRLPGFVVKKEYSELTAIDLMDINITNDHTAPEDGTGPIKRHVNRETLRKAMKKGGSFGKKKN